MRSKRTIRVKLVEAGAVHYLQWGVDIARTHIVSSSVHSFFFFFLNLISCVGNTGDIFNGRLVLHVIQPDVGRIS